MRLSLKETVDCTETRGARPKDIDGIVDLYCDFFHESEYPSLGLEFSRDRMRFWVEMAICGGRIPHFVAIGPGAAPVGVICYGLDHTCSTHPFAFLDKFYVRPNWRHSGVGRMLLDLALMAAKDDGAVAFRAGLSSGSGAAKNLFKRLGFAETPGSILLSRRF